MAALMASTFVLTYRGKFHYTARELLTRHCDRRALEHESRGDERHRSIRKNAAGAALDDQTK
jgi:hypothetical protein